MTNYKYPYGYSGSPQGMGTMLTWDQMMTKKTVYNMHPEVRRRFHALIEFAASCGTPLGVGTAWRVQPNPPPVGFAKPGNSWHESCPVSPQSPTAMAIDTVPNVSWPWMENHCAAYGFRTFKYVGNEPWHIQPVEITTSRRYATTCPSLPTWKLPGTSVPTLPDTGDDDVAEKICVRDVHGFPWVTDFASYAHSITEDQAGRGRDMRGYIVDPNTTGPWQLDEQDSDLMTRLSG